MNDNDLRILNARISDQAQRITADDVRITALEAKVEALLSLVYGHENRLIDLDDRLDGHNQRLTALEHPAHPDDVRAALAELDAMTTGATAGTVWDDGEIINMEYAGEPLWKLRNLPPMGEDGE